MTRGDAILLPFLGFLGALALSPLLYWISTP